MNITDSNINASIRQLEAKLARQTAAVQVTKDQIAVLTAFAKQIAEAKK